MSLESLPPASRPSLPVAVSELHPSEANSHVLLTIFKWYRLILAFGLVLMVAAAVVMMTRPVLPAATARILIKSGPEELPIAGLPLASLRSGLEFLQTEAELFTSRLVLLPVARALRQERGESVADNELDSDIEALAADLAVVPIPNTTMIQAKKSAPDGPQAERLLAMIIESYVDQHSTAYSGATSFSTFFERETNAAATALTAAEKRLHEWQEKNGVVAAEEQLLAQLATLGDFEGGLRRAEVDIESTRAQIDLLGRDIAAMPRESMTTREQAPNPLVARLKGDIATEEVVLRDLSRSPVTERLRMDIAAAEVATREPSSSPLVAKLKVDLSTAELALHDLRQRYTDEDRRVQEKLEQVKQIQQGISTAEREAMATATERVQQLRRELTTVERDLEIAGRERIAALRSQLAAAEREGDVLARSIVAPHPLRESLNRDLATARSRLTTLTSQRDGLREQVRQARAGLAHLQDKRVEAEGIARQVELAKALYLQNTKRLDDARLTTGLRKHQLANVAVIEGPRATVEGASTRRIALVSLLGAVVGLGLGVAVALALEFFNWSLRTAEDVEFYLGVPALATVPALPGPPRRPHALPVSEPPPGGESAPPPSTGTP